MAIGTSVSTADKAVNDANGNPIIETYATKDELSTAATTPATKNSLGVVQVGDNIDVDAGIISVATATADTLGVVKTGTNIDNSNGTISISSGNVTDALGYTPLDSASISAVSTADIEGLFV